MTKAKTIDRLKLTHKKLDADEEQERDWDENYFKRFNEIASANE